MSYEKRRELRKAAHQAEIDAILALCHHNDGPFRDDCADCLERQKASIEHLQRIVSVTMWCLSGIHTGCYCEEEQMYKLLEAGV